MKKFIILAVLLSTILTSCIGCERVTYHENGVPTYFLEPDGYVIARIEMQDSNILVRHFKYGYILEEDYQAYLDGKMDGFIVIKNPYEEGREVSALYREITSIEIGVYKDLRGK